MKKAMIISGGNIEEDFALRFLNEWTNEQSNERTNERIKEQKGTERVIPQMRRTDCAEDGSYIIAADKGLLFLRDHHILPTHIVGDFDSSDVSFLEPYRNRPEVTIREFKPEKDWTDTEIAVGQALELGCEEICILGATGSRIDHVIGNIQVLALAREHGADCFLLDPCNRIYLVDHGFSIRKTKQWGQYVSLFAYGGDVKGLTLTGFKYGLKDFTLGTVGTRGVSNEIEQESASVEFAAGKLLVVESRD